MAKWSRDPTCFLFVTEVIEVKAYLSDSEELWRKLRDDLMEQHSYNFPKNTAQAMGLRRKYRTLRSQVARKVKTGCTLYDWEELIKAEEFTPSCTRFLPKFSSISTDTWRLMMNFFAALVGAAVTILQIGVAIPDYAAWTIVTVALILALVAKLNEYHDGRFPLWCKNGVFDASPLNLLTFKGEYKVSWVLTLIVYIGTIIVNLYALNAFGEPTDIATYVAVALTTFLFGVESYFPDLCEALGLKAYFCPPAEEEEKAPP